MLTRRAVIGAVAGSALSEFNSLGVFFPTEVKAAVLSGAYLKSLRDDEFWFQKIYQDSAKIDSLPEANRVALGGSEGQLTLRLGLSGGTAIAYYSTLTFLSNYRSSF